MNLQLIKLYLIFLIRVSGERSGINSGNEPALEDSNDSPNSLQFPRKMSKERKKVSKNKYSNTELSDFQKLEKITPIESDKSQMVTSVTLEDDLTNIPGGERVPRSRSRALRRARAASPITSVENLFSKTAPLPQPSNSEFLTTATTSTQTSSIFHPRRISSRSPTRPQHIFSTGDVDVISSDSLLTGSNSANISTVKGQLRNENEVSPRQQETWHLPKEDSFQSTSTSSDVHEIETSRSLVTEDETHKSKLFAKRSVVINKTHLSRAVTDQSAFLSIDRNVVNTTFVSSDTSNIVSTKSPSKTLPVVVAGGSSGNTPTRNTLRQPMEMNASNTNQQQPPNQLLPLSTSPSGESLPTDSDSSNATGSLFHFNREASAGGMNTGGSNNNTSSNNINNRINSNINSNNNNSNSNQDRRSNSMSQTPLISASSSSTSLGSIDNSNSNSNSNNMNLNTGGNRTSNNSPMNTKGDVARIVICDENKARRNDAILQEKLQEAKALNRRDNNGATMYQFSLWKNAKQNTSPRSDDNAIDSNTLPASSSEDAVAPGTMSAAVSVGTKRATSKGKGNKFTYGYVNEESAGKQDYNSSNPSNNSLLTSSQIVGPGTDKADDERRNRSSSMDIISRQNYINKNVLPSLALTDLHFHPVDSEGTESEDNLAGGVHAHGGMALALRSMVGHAKMLASPSPQNSPLQVTFPGINKKSQYRMSSRPSNVSVSSLADDVEEEVGDCVDADESSDRASEGSVEEEEEVKLMSLKSNTNVAASSTNTNTGTNQSMRNDIKRDSSKVGKASSVSSDSAALLDVLRRVDEPLLRSDIDYEEQSGGSFAELAGAGTAVVPLLRNLSAAMSNSSAVSSPGSTLLSNPYRTLTHDSSTESLNKSNLPTARSRHKGLGGTYDADLDKTWRRNESPQFEGGAGGESEEGPSAGRGKLSAPHEQRGPHDEKKWNESPGTSNKVENWQRASKQVSSSEASRQEHIGRASDTQPEKSLSEDPNLMRQLYSSSPTLSELSQGSDEQAEATLAATQQQQQQHYNLSSTLLLTQQNRQLKVSSISEDNTETGYCDRLSNSDCESEDPEHPSERVSKLKWKRGQAIGEGTFGRVFKGLNERTGELLALKQICLADGSETEVEELCREIRVMRNLNHGNIVRFVMVDFVQIFL